MGGKLPKSIIKKYGITKKAWQVFRGTHHSSGKSSMPKKNRVRRYGRKLKRRFSKAKIPFETLVGVGLVPFTSAQDGWRTPFEFAQVGDTRGIVDSLRSGFLGMDTNGRVDFMQLLNPFEWNRARYTKMIVASTLIGMVRRKLTGRYTAPLFKKIPIIGRFVS